MTIDDIRAACVAAGLPGAEVIPIGFGAAEIGWHIHVPFAVVEVGPSGIVRGNRDALADALAVVRERAEDARERLATALADLDRVLGRP